MATYEYAAVGSQPALKLVWHQGDSKPPGWVPEWGGRSQLFIGEKGMLLGNGKLLPEEKFKDFQTPPETLPRSPGHWVEWVNYAKGLGPGAGLQFPVSRAGQPKPTTSATSRTARARSSSGTTRTFARRTRRKRHRSSSGNTEKAGITFSRGKDTCRDPGAGIRDPIQMPIADRIRRIPHHGSRIPDSGVTI